MSYFVGVDVGTSSVRAGLVQKTENGSKIIKYHSEEITIFKPKANFFEQSSDDVWNKVCECVREVTHIVPKYEIAGIGFDATCSLVLFDKDLKPLTVSPNGINEQNIIMWLDHRAKQEADEINATNHEILRFVGGKVSLEMEIPKLLWLKKNMKNKCFEKIHLAFDLPDFLTWRATDIMTRSICSLTCKWNYDAFNCKWPEDFFNLIGLKELTSDNFLKIGNKVLFPGDPVGKLSERAARELGLETSTIVASSMIDAHAGALGLIASRSDISDNDITSKLILIAGTSTCHMSITDNCIFSPGIWGPYKHALLPDYFLIEAGQSASGILIEHVLKTHPDFQKIKDELQNDENIYEHLNNEIAKLASEQNLSSFHELTKHYHIYPDFHGNRSPLGDNTLKGMICGCTMHDSILVTYLATIQSLAYSTKHIIESLYKSGRKKFKSILICGGLSKNRLFLQTHADICGIPILISNEQESVLLGSAMLAATGSGVYKDLKSAAEELSNDCSQIFPDQSSELFHSRKYKVFLRMLDEQLNYRKIMEETVDA
ncbi:CLUMA_CG019034, isoform A [Clunio marinus]|uniref:FGGY carbohydrate kinase domain-containing protein n=1 Tax=Clunio marinus TaxID=568069 RepID=A0A1J1J5U9_9DIPT|nr:CLUMA_CG019034, isoform A [Clunio marinus]